jgi:fibronectin type 3 domain-containing protein
VVSYNVYRATGSGTFALLNTLPILLPSWTDASVQAGLTYSYEVTSVDAFGIESVPSTSTVVAIP